MSDPQERSRPTTSLAILFIVCLLLSGIASAAPSIKLSKKAAPPTSSILVSGSGFDANVGVDIYFDSRLEVQVETDGQGGFQKAEIHAPYHARPGQHLIKAEEQNSSNNARQPFLVQTNSRQFHFHADGTRVNPFENVLNVHNVRDLRQKWSYSVGQVISLAAVVNQVVYFGSNDDNVYALNARTGAKLWSYTTGWPALTTPAVANGVVYVGSWDKSLYALDAKTGTKLWSYRTGASLESSPAVANGMVYVGSDDGNVYALNARTGAKEWSYTTGYYVDSSPAVANGVVYVGSGDSYNGGSTVYALNASTGTKLWSYAAGNWVYSSPAVVNGVVYFGSGDHNVYALDANTGAVLWSYTTGSFVDSSPAVANGVVLCRLRLL